jgi:hypothetical protein
MMKIIPGPSFGVLCNYEFGGVARKEKVMGRLKNKMMKL